MQSLYLKKGKEKQLLKKHSYVFSGSLSSIPADIESGEVVSLHASDGRFVAYGHYNPASEIILRLMEWNVGTAVDENWYREKLRSSIGLRKKLFDSKNTDAFRLVYSDGDLLPGLIIDKYAKTLVLQSHTPGMDRNKLMIAALLKELLPDTECIFEKSDGDGRKMEGLERSSGVLYGKSSDTVAIIEHGVKYFVDITGQKTGFYTDQRRNRLLLRDHVSRSSRVLDLFSYSGGFALNAAFAGAEDITLCDSSKQAVAGAKENFSLNGFKELPVRFVEKDCFEFVRELYKNGEEFDVVIADPPKLMPRKKDASKAVRAYKDINFNAMKLVKKGGVMLTFSCSGNFSMEMFKQMTAFSAIDSNRSVQIIGQLHQADDHPVSVSVPETEYLKGLVLKIS